MSKELLSKKIYLNNGDYSIERLLEIITSKGFNLITPEQVTEYAHKDSYALSKVATKDLVEELKFRVVEWASLPAGEVQELIKKEIPLDSNWKQKPI